ISFTGETTTGSTIIKNSADTLKATSMELGGKSAILVFDDADLDRALDAVVWGFCSFTCERCTANSRLCVHVHSKDHVIEALEARVQYVKIGDPMDDTTEVGPLIHTEHYDKVVSYLQIAKDEGATVITREIPEEYKRGNFVAPTMIVNATNDM